MSTTVSLGDLEKKLLFLNGEIDMLLEGRDSHR